VYRALDLPLDETGEVPMRFGFDLMGGGRCVYLKQEIDTLPLSPSEIVTTGSNPGLAVGFHGNSPTESA